MYENDTKSTSEHVPHASSSGDAAMHGDAARRGDTPRRGDTARPGDTATRSDTAMRVDTANRGDTATSRTDPKFARESNTMRRMQPWQIGALALAAAVVVALVLFYF